jgi:serine O-acetyltransferase
MSFRYLKSLRKYEYYLNTHSFWRFWYRFKNRRIGAKYHIAITPNTVGYGLRLPHLELGIIINCSSMGNYCTVNSGVVLGNKLPGMNKQKPTVGDYVNFCVGSKAIGGIRIGNNTLVAPNAVVTKDVPDNSIVAGIPARVIKTKIE